MDLHAPSISIIELIGVFSVISAIVTTAFGFVVRVLYSLFKITREQRDLATSEHASLKEDMNKKFKEADDAREKTRDTLTLVIENVREQESKRRHDLDSKVAALLLEVDQKLILISQQYVRTSELLTLSGQVNRLEGRIDGMLSPVRVLPPPVTLSSV